MAENLLTDAKVRTATFARDGAYLKDGGGLRIRLLAPSRNHAKGARLAEYMFNLKQADGTYRSAVIGLGTIGDDFTDPSSVVRTFGLADARRARDIARAQVAQGIDPRSAKRLDKLELVEAHRSRIAELESRRTVKQAFEKWHELYASKHRKDGGEFVRDLFERHLLPRLGPLPLQSLKRSEVTDALDAITATGKARTANMALSLVRQFVRWCAARDWIERDPTLGLSKGAVGGKERPRERHLSDEEIVELRDRMHGARLPERVQCALWLILATGCRVGEVSGARTADLDLAENLWRIPDTKSGRPHLIQLSAFARRHVHRLLELRGKSQWLLPARMPPKGKTPDDEPIDDAQPMGDKGLTKAVGDRQRGEPLKGRSTAAAALLLTGGKWTPHDLRRTMATGMRDRCGISGDVVERCLNHAPQGVAAVYQRGLLLAERKAAFDRWGEHLLGLIARHKAVLRAAELHDGASVPIEDYVQRIAIAHDSAYELSLRVEQGHVPPNSPETAAMLQNVLASAGDAYQAATNAEEALKRNDLQAVEAHLLDSEAVRSSGLEHLADAQYLYQQERSVKASASGSAKRSQDKALEKARLLGGRASATETRQRVIALMAGVRRSHPGMTFKAFVGNWTKAAQENLSLKSEGDRYTVTDDNPLIQIDGKDLPAPLNISSGRLRNLWSESSHK
jgi:integrase